MQFQVQKKRLIIGLDLRVSSVKIVELEDSKEQTSLVNWAASEIPYSIIDKQPEKQVAQSETLRKLIETKGFKGKEVTVVLGGKDSAVKIYNMVGISGTELADGIKWKLSEEVSFPIEEALIDYYPLPEEKNFYVAACINKKIFANVQSVITKAGLRLKAITVVPDVLESLFAKQIEQSKDKVISLIYMGKRTTNISILKNGRLDFNRELNIGGENITMAMSGVLVSPEGRMEISAEAAEKIKTEYGIPVDLEKYPNIGQIPINQLQAMVRPALERVQDEVMRTFEYYKGQTGEAGIDKIILTGGSSLTPNLALFLSEGLGVPVETPPIVDQELYKGKIKDEADFEKVMPRLSAAIGATLIDGNKINLIPEEIKHRWQFLLQKFLKPHYVALATSLLLGLIYALFVFQGMLLQNQLNYANSKINEYKPMVAKLTELQERAAKVQNRNMSLSQQKQRSAKMPRVFREISMIVPPEIVIRSMRVTSKSIRMMGVAFDRRQTAETILSQFVLDLSALDFFTEVKVLQATKNNHYVQDAFDFDISAQINI